MTKRTGRVAIVLLGAVLGTGLGRASDANRRADGLHQAPWERGAGSMLPVFIDAGIVINDEMVFDLDTVGSNFDTELALYDSLGNLIDNNDDIDGMFNRQSRIAGLNLDAGFYLASVSGFGTTHFLTDFAVVVNPQSESGTWQLRLDGIPQAADTVASGELDWIGLRVRSEGQGASLPGDVSELQSVRIDVTSTDFDPEVAVFDLATGDLVAADDDSGTGADARLDVRLPPGSYRVVAAAFETVFQDGPSIISNDTNGSGVFGVRVGDLINLPSEVLNVPGDVDFYNLTVEAVTDLGEVAESIQPYRVDTNGPDSSRDTQIALWTEDGTLIAQDDDGGEFRNSLVSFGSGQLAPGAYVLGVGSFETIFGQDFVAAVDGSEPTGDYTVNYQPGRSLVDTHAFAGDVDFFRFTIGAPTDLGVIASGGQPFVIDTDGVPLDTQIAVWDANGTLIAENDTVITFPGIDPQARLELDLPAGVYWLYVAGSSASFADGFSVQPSAFFQVFGAYALVAGTASTSGQTSETDQYDFFRFEVGPPPPCNAADVAAQFGVLNVNDVIDFVNAFNRSEPLADLSPPGGDGRFNVNDIIDFVNAFNAGCP